MKIGFSKNIIISLTGHILCIAALFLFGFKLTDNSTKTPPIKPSEIVFTIETISSSAPQKSIAAAAPKTVKKAVKTAQSNSKPKPKPKKIVKRIIKKPAPKKITLVKKSVKKIKRKPKPKKRVAQKSLSQRKPILKAHNTKSYSKNKNSTKKNAKTAHSASGRNNHKTISKTTSSTGKTSFNPKRYISAIKHRIAQNKHYPNSARRRGIEGRVGLQLSVTKSGTINSLHIINSSGSKILDKAAIKSVRRSVPFQKMAQAVTFRFAIKYNFDDT